MGCNASRPTELDSPEPSLLEQEVGEESVGQSSSYSDIGFVSKKKQQKKIHIESSTKTIKSPCYRAISTSEVLQREQETKQHNQQSLEKKKIARMSNTAETIIDDNELWSLSSHSDLGATETLTIVLEDSNRNLTKLVDSRDFLEKENNENKDLVSLRDQLSTSEALILEKEKKIQELLADNERLRKVRSYVSTSSSVPVLPRTAKLHERIKDIRRGAYSHSNATPAISQSITNNDLPLNTKQLADSVSQVSSEMYDHHDNFVLKKSNDDDTPLQFELSVEEAKKRRETMPDDEERQSGVSTTQWDYSEFMVI